MWGPPSFFEDGTTVGDDLSTFQTQVRTSVCQGLHSMRSENMLCDMEVTVGERTFNCHHLLLASVSGFFRSLASNSWQEKCVGKVTIEHDDVTQESFEMFLDILYKSEDVVTMDTAVDMLRMSVFLQISFLEKYCVKFLMANMTADMCIGLWMIGEKYQLPNLADRALMTAVDQINPAAQSDGILQLPKSMLLVLLGAQHKLTMDDTCRTILRWVEEDAEVRQIHLDELLRFVSFPQLSPAYVYSLLVYFDHPFFKHIHKKIREGVSYYLEDQSPVSKRQLLASQYRAAHTPSIQKCAVFVVGGRPNSQDKPSISAFSMEPDKKFYSYFVKNCPQVFGSYCSACVHRNNLYLTFRRKDDSILIKYVPGDNEWKTVSVLNYRLEEHFMAAVRDTIYLIRKLGKDKEEISAGGVGKDASAVTAADGDRKAVGASTDAGGGWKEGVSTGAVPVAAGGDMKAGAITGAAGGDWKEGNHGTFCYNITTDTWAKNTSEVGVEMYRGSQMATVGHRLYMFGRRVDEHDSHVNTVECLDTRSGQIYVAGHLPCSVEHVTAAVSDGGTIYLVCDEAEVYKMKEHFELADRKEAALQHQVNNGNQPVTTPEGQPIPCPRTNDSAHSVSFVKVGSFGETVISSAYLHKGKLVGCGRWSWGHKAYTFTMDLFSGKGKMIRLAAHERLHLHQMIHTLSIPEEFLHEDTAVGVFRPGDLVCWKRAIPLPPGNRRAGKVTYETIGRVTDVPDQGTIRTAFLGYENCVSKPNALRFAEPIQNTVAKANSAPGP